MRFLVTVCFLVAAGEQDRKKKEPVQAHPKVDQKKVDAAIAKGVEYLKANLPAYLQRFPKQGTTVQWTELVLWTFVHAGVPESDPDFQKLLKDMLDRKLEATYCVSLQAMVLEELDRVKYQRRIAQCAQFLVDNESEGVWGYGAPTPFLEDVPTGSARKDVATTSSSKGGGGGAKKRDPAVPPGLRPKPEVKQTIKITKKRDGIPNDNSNTQYAALGLRACHDAGILLPPEVVDRAMKWWRDSQMDERSNEGGVTTGGWCYHGRHEPYAPYGSMTAGGVGGLVILDYIKSGKNGWQADKDVQEGLRWLAKNFSVTYNPGPCEHSGQTNGRGHYYYYLYALERAGILYGTEHFGGHEWYPQGAKVLLEAQKADGSWGGAEEDGTCFAILFLRRATRPLVDVATVDPFRRDK